MSTTVEVDSKKVDKMFADQLARAKNLKPIMQVIAQNMQTQKDLNFRTSTDPEGKAWKPLSITTLEKRRKGPRVGSGNKILQDTNHLLGSFTIVSTNDSAKIGTNLKYAKTHQFGAKKGSYRSSSSLKTGKLKSIPWGDIPARPMVGITAKRKLLYNQMVSKYILTGKRR